MSSRLTEIQRPSAVSKEFPSSSGEMFQDFFAEKRHDSYKKHDLIDTRGRRLFENAARACAHDAYPFQAPLSTRPGPLVEMDGHRMLMLSSYDYLGLIGDSRVDEAAIAAIRKYGTGTGGVRLLTGTLDIHKELEESLAEFKGTEAAITYTSGYAANLAVISALLGPADRVIADALSHRSLMDACRLAGVQVQKFNHNDPASLRYQLENGPEANRTLIISDGVFSMDGDIACLPDLIALKKEFDCFLLMDESHASGVLGRHGRGTDEHFNIPTTEVDIWTGSLAKAIPSNGGVLGGSQRLAIFLQHASAPFIFSGAMAAPSIAAIKEALAVLKDEPERVNCVQRNAQFLRSGLK